MAAKKIKVNRAPVLTLWAAVVAERLGFKEDEALSLGKAVAGLNAQAKGRSLGIFTPRKDTVAKAREEKKGERIFIALCNRAVPARVTPQGIRALQGTRTIEPRPVRRYLENKFGEAFPSVRKAMEDLARAYRPSDLADKAFALYEEFRPSVPPGLRGWGAAGELDLEKIRSLAPKSRGRK